MTSSRSLWRYGSTSIAMTFCRCSLLIARQLGHRNALESPFLPRKPTFCSSGRPLAYERLLLLLAVEHLVELVRGQGLRPEDVAGVGRPFVEAVGRVAVEDRAAEGDVVGRVAVAADRHVPAGHHEFELVRARLAEDRDAVVLAVAAGVVVKLLVDALVPLGVDDALEDVADDLLADRWCRSRC